jgi:methyl-branched lipid omega-hydroxylase
MGLLTGIATRVNGAPPLDVPLSEIDLGTWDFWEQDDDFRDGAFATLRREKPISFWEIPNQPDFDLGAGHWALARYDDVHYVSRNPQIFSSAPNITIGDNIPELSEFFGSMNAFATSSAGRSPPGSWRARRSRYGCEPGDSSTG